MVFDFKKHCGWLTLKQAEFANLSYPKPTLLLVLHTYRK